MEISFKDYPIDIILCMIWSAILLPIALLNVEGGIRIVLGLPFILFTPGYVLIYALFPSKKTDKGIDVVERIALSFGLSIAVVPLIGLGLNYSPWGIRLEPVLLSIFLFVIGIGFIAIYRWKKTGEKERFTISLHVSLPKSKSRLDKALIFILAVSIIIAGTSFVYIIVTPKTGEKFTELYILGVEGATTNYPSNLAVGENATVIIGVVNHEHRTINYTIEIWLINQTVAYNESTDENETRYNHMWFMDKINIILKHIPTDIEGSWESQWEYNYTFSINKSGKDLKIAFLLFTTPTDTYSYDKDYINIIEEKIDSAYRENHLRINAF